ncbi:spore germination protein [Alkalihalobacterium sp. APHAB7]|uniref:spore germination protein n=1 Tax=Alkalihalobacterium sp. APHAB7 TaxID=3402081 RepID=UPI003AAEBCB4
MYFLKKKRWEQSHIQNIRQLSRAPQPILSNVLANIKLIKSSLHHTSDLSVRELTFNNKLISIVFINTVVNSETLETKVIQQLINHPATSIIDTVTVKEISKTESLDQVVSKVVQGNTVIFLEGETYAFILGTSSFEKRAIEEPSSEQVVKGPHDGFVEHLDVNINMIRNRVKTRNIVIKDWILGKESNTRVALVYIPSIANDEVVQEVERRISSINTDIVQSPGHLEAYIEDTSWSPFQQILSTERVDRTVFNLMEGRVAVITDGSPSALIMPITFFAFYQTPDDYNNRWFIGSFFRLIRIFCFFLAISLPALYISLVSYHYEIIPFDLLFNVKASVDDVPFHPLVEAIFMQIVLELLKEASIRLPNPIAQTIGIVGGLVIGTAIVEASLVSNTMVVIIALTAIASFVVPINEMGTTVRLLGFPLMLSAYLLGLIGIVFGLLILLIHLCKLESFGSPYFAPLAPVRFKDLKDTFIRTPLWKMNQRPTTPQPDNVERQHNARGWDNSDN